MISTVVFIIFIFITRVRICLVVGGIRVVIERVVSLVVGAFPNAFIRSASSWGSGRTPPPPWTPGRCTYRRGHTPELSGATSARGKSGSYT